MIIQCWHRKIKEELNLILNSNNIILIIILKKTLCSNPIQASTKICMLSLINFRNTKIQSISSLGITNLIRNP